MQQKSINNLRNRKYLDSIYKTNLIQIIRALLFVRNRVHKLKKKKTS